VLKSESRCEFYFSLTSLLWLPHVAKKSGDNNAAENEAVQSFKSVARLERGGKESEEK